MPRRGRLAVLLPRRLILVTAAAAIATATGGTWTPGNTQHASSGILLSRAEAAAAAPASFLEQPRLEQPRSRRAWVSIPRSLISGRRRARERYSSSRSRHPSDDAHRRFPRSSGSDSMSKELAPLWVRARGGAVGKRVVGVKRSPLGKAEEEDAEEAEKEVQAEEDHNGASAGVEDDDHEEAVSAQAGQGAAADSEERKERRSSDAIGSSGSGAAGASVLAELDLKVVVPLAIKQGLFFLLARWMGDKLSPKVVSEVRMARAIYTIYLIFSQALCMYLRYLIWKRDDDTEVELPPPAQLKNLMDAAKAGEAGDRTISEAAGGPGATAGLGGGAALLGPMMDKMMASKMAAKKYDMMTIQGVRRGQFWASLIMCYTHLRKGMIKPMMLQVSFGLLALLDSPLFHIYILGRDAKGSLARPFKKQSLIESLSGFMSAMSAKAAAELQTTEERAEGGKAADGTTNGGLGHEDDDGGGEMPGIEVLTEADDGGDDATAESD